MLATIIKQNNKAVDQMIRGDLAGSCTMLRDGIVMVKKALCCCSDGNGGESMDEYPAQTAVHRSSIVIPSSVTLPSPYPLDEQGEEQQERTRARPSSCLYRKPLYLSQTLLRRAVLENGVIEQTVSSVLIFNLALLYQALAQNSSNAKSALTKAKKLSYALIQLVRKQVDELTTDSGVLRRFFTELGLVAANNYVQACQLLGVNPEQQAIEDAASLLMASSLLDEDQHDRETSGDLSQDPIEREMVFRVVSTLVLSAIEQGQQQESSLLWTTKQHHAAAA